MRNAISKKKTKIIKPKPKPKTKPINLEIEPIEKLDKEEIFELKSDAPKEGEILLEIPKPKKQRKPLTEKKLAQMAKMRAAKKAKGIQRKKDMEELANFRAQKARSTQVYQPAPTSAPQVKQKPKVTHTPPKPRYPTVQEQEQHFFNLMDKYSNYKVKQHQERQAKLKKQTKKKVVAHPNRSSIPQRPKPPVNSYSNLFNYNPIQRRRRRLY